MAEHGSNLREENQLEGKARVMPPAKNLGNRRKGAMAPAAISASNGTAPSRGDPSRQCRAITHALQCPQTKAVRVNLSGGLNHDIELIVEYLSLWPNKAEFIRDAIRKERDRRIEEARGAKEKLEGGTHNVSRSEDISMSED